MSLTNVYRPTQSGDMVAILGDNFQQVFPLARPIKSAYSESSKAMEHPIEDGTSIIDHRVILPTEIEMSVITTGRDYRSIFSDIEQAYQNGDIFTVQGRAKTYNNMFLTAIPYEDAAAPFDEVAMLLKFREVRFVQAEFRAASTRILTADDVQNAKDQSRRSRGQAQTGDPDAANEERASLAYKIFKGVE